jgi:hypothetical protein
MQRSCSAEPQASLVQALACGKMGTATYHGSLFHIQIVDMLLYPFFKRKEDKYVQESNPGRRGQYNASRCRP